MTLSLLDFFLLCFGHQIRIQHQFWIVAIAAAIETLIVKIIILVLFLSSQMMMCQFINRYQDEVVYTLLCYMVNINKTEI